VSLPAPDRSDGRHDEISQRTKGKRSMNTSITAESIGMYNDSDLIAQLAAVLAKQLRPTLPIEIDL